MWFAALFIGTEIGPNGPGRLDKHYRQYGRSEKQPNELKERRRSYAEAVQEAEGDVGIFHRPCHQKAEVLFHVPQMHQYLQAELSNHRDPLSQVQAQEAGF